MFGKLILNSTAQIIQHKTKLFNECVNIINKYIQYYGEVDS